MNFTKISAGIATVALLASTLAPAAFAHGHHHHHIKAANNGAGSVNLVGVVHGSYSSTTQQNNTGNFNFVGSAANTGGNVVAGNTGKGNKTSDTGDASSRVTVTNTGSDNTADAPNCGCDENDYNVKVANNGGKSVNGVLVVDLHATTVSQTNNTVNATGVESVANTGGNIVAGNTGKGTNSSDTGDASSSVTVNNGGPSNTLK